MAKKETRYFDLLDPKTLKPTGSVFKGSAPGQAAKKAASKGHKCIYLREKGTETIREYKGTIKTQVLQADTAWRKKGDKVKVGHAKSLGVLKK